MNDTGQGSREASVHYSLHILGGVDLAGASDVQAPRNRNIDGANQSGKKQSKLGPEGEGPRAVNNAQIIRSMTHAPDQTGEQRRLLHCGFNLAAPKPLSLCRTLCDFHKVSRAEGTKRKGREKLSE